MTPSMRIHTFKAIKLEFKKLVLRMPAPSMHLHTLPHDVASMKLTAPMLWAQAFSQEDPVASKFPAGTLQKAISCIPMRISRQDSMQIAPAMRSSSSQQAAVHDIGAAGLGNVLQQFAVGLSSSANSKC